MKKLGILGGMGPESTILYYKEIATRFQKKEPNGYFPALTIETVNMYEMLKYCLDGEYDALAEYLMKGIRNLEASGADFAILASNTPHVVFEQLQQGAHVPLLSIVEPTYRAIKTHGFTKVTWLGTRFTMEQPYFKKLFIQNGIDVVVPNTDERKYIDTVIAKELEFGIVKDASRNEINKIIQRLISDDNIEAVILGCTELPLMYANETLPVPIYDTLQYHINGIVDYMFKD